MQTNSAFGKIPEVIKFPFKGEGWFGKLAIAALMMLAGMIIPIVPTIFLLGYLAEVIRRITVEKQDASMPKWDDWGKFFNDGLKMLGASLIVIVPIILFFFLMAGLYIIPIMTLSIDGGEELAAGFFVILFILQFVMIFFGVLISVLAGIFQPIYMTHMVTRDQFSAIFKIKDWWRIFKKSFWEFAISFLILGSLYMIVVYATMLLIYSVICCCLVPFISAALMAYMLLVYVALMAYAYRSGAEKLGDPVEKPVLKSETPKADFDLPKPVETVEPVPALEPAAVAEVVEPEAPAAAVEAFVTPVVETAAEVTILTTAVVATPDISETPELPGTPALDATLISEPVVVDEVEVVNELFNGQATMKIDDLKKISGIGPKTAAALSRAGVLTFKQLADLPLENLKQILTDSGLDVLLSQCDTWPAQAQQLMK